MEENEGEVIETVRAARKYLISYDAVKRKRRECTRLNHFVFGRADVKLIKGRKKRYEYLDLVSRPGVDRIGQSVLIMRQKDAEDLTSLLRKLGIPHREETVWVTF